jgi:hypothetical protein
VQEIAKKDDIITEKLNENQKEIAPEIMQGDDSVKVPEIQKEVPTIGHEIIEKVAEVEKVYFYLFYRKHQ